MNQRRYDVTAPQAQDLHDRFFSSQPGIEVSPIPIEFESDEPISLSPALLERRNKLRRLVGLLVAALSIFTLLAFAGSNPPWKASEEKSRKSESAPTIQSPAKNTHMVGTGTMPQSSPMAAPPPLVDPPETLSLLGVSLPDSLPKAAIAMFSQAKDFLEKRDFEAADSTLAGLCKAQEEAVRDHARLVRAFLWVEQGKRDPVRVVFEDLLAHSPIASVRALARQQLDEAEQPKMPAAKSLVEHL